MAEVTAFVDVTVVPMDQERVLPKHTVLVENGRIVALGPTSKVQVPAGAVRVDGRGKYLIPGLGDMHIGGSHNGGTFYEHVTQGVTTLRALSGPEINQIQNFRRPVKPSELPLPRLYLARSLTPSLLTMPESVATHVAAAKAVGYDHLSTIFYLKARTSVERAVFDSLLVAAGRVGLPVSAHAHELPFDAVLAIGTLTGGSTEHLPSFRDSLISGGKFNPSKIPSYVAALKRAGVWITPTLQCIWSREDNENGPAQVVKALQDAGVKMLLGGDDGEDAHDELAALVRAGLTPYQALATGTRNVAEYFHRLDSSGTVAVGKWADLVLLTGNPLEDIRHTREPAGVMLAGRWFDRAMLDRVLLMSPDLRRWIKSIGQMRGLSWVRSMYEKKLVALADSLTVVKADRGAYERQLQRLADEFGAMRAGQLDEQVHVDPILRVWLREQIRQGYQVTIANVTLTP